MWFRKLCVHPESGTRGGVTASRRRFAKFGPRIVEALEGRALMSHGGLHMPPTRFVQTNLVSDGFVPTQNPPDTMLVNPWGLVASSTSPWWVSDNNAGVSTLYTGTGAKIPINGDGFVTIPSPTSPTGGTPTGIVFNGVSTDFLVDPTNPKSSAHFIFATEDGTIAAWNSGQSAVIKVDHSTVPTAADGAVYKGLALATNANDGKNYLLATNFRAGTVDVFDSSFHQVTLGTGAFTGTFTDPRLPQGYAPFGIAAITPPGSSNEFVVVTYAQQTADKHDDVPGPGKGFVDIFDTSGDLIERVASHGTLNAPWGIAVAPSSGFGSLSGDLLIGNFGNGRINAFKFPDDLMKDQDNRGHGKDGDQGHGHDADRFHFAGQLKDASGKAITIDGLWALQFGNGAAAGPKTTLFFTAGPAGETHGLFGTLTVAPM